ncbi:MAG: hypothetical protein B0D87_08755, partial [Candidatus Sedimenticola endophacoides]
MIFGGGSVEKALTPGQLYHRCDLGQFGFQDTSQIDGLERAVGQERALDAIDFGVGMEHSGYNLYVMGSTGLGRHTMVYEALRRQAEAETAQSDWCYVSNFTDPNMPGALRLPAGTGRELSRDMRALVEGLIKDIPAALHSEEYRRRTKEINSRYKEMEQGAASKLSERAHERGIAVIDTVTGYTLAPEVDGKVLGSEEFHELPEEEQERLGGIMEEVKEDLKETMKQVPRWQQEVRKEFKALDREFAGRTVDILITELMEKYEALPAVVDYLEAVKQDIVENVEPFSRSEGKDGKTVSVDDPAFGDYRVNVLVDNAETDGAPIVYEDNPTYQNLMGRIEHLAHMGTLLTNFTLIKAGALHYANGGYLVLDAEKVLTNPFAWDGLKRVLNAEEIRIESLERQLSLVSTISLEPEPIAIDLKVILIGDRYLYYLLKEYDPEFSKLFKVEADFSEDMAREDGNDYRYAQLMASLRERENLRHFDVQAVGRMIEYSARRSGDGERLSLHMGNLVDLMQEADYCAARSGHNLIQIEDVDAAIQGRVYRADQLRERLHKEVLRGTLLIDTAGSQLAQINALSVIQLGEQMFGVPTRVSATARYGAGEVVDIEREVEQGGSLHSKGVLILSAYLGWRYAKYQPLSLSASLVFEQTYGGVDGDSASAAELCALLSALSDVPIRQSLAITGAINQHGEVQTIGGVCQKIEGFFDICKGRGLNGDQGVIIPHSNVKDLMLRRDVIEAVEAGSFAVYA